MFDTNMIVDGKFCCTSQQLARILGGLLAIKCDWYDDFIVSTSKYFFGTIDLCLE